MTRELPPDWDSRRKEVYQRDGYECQNCNRKGGPRGHLTLNAHHIVPRHSGGTHKMGNLRTMCTECHKAIHNKDYMAPTTGGRVPSEAEFLERKIKEKISETPCPRCFDAALNNSDSVEFDIHDAHEFLEYTGWSRNLIVPAHRAKCSNCNSIYKIKDGDEGEYSLYQGDLLNSGASGYWAYVMGAGVAFSAITWIWARHLFVIPWLALLISVYFDTGYLRENSKLSPSSRNWFWLCAIPLVNIFAGGVYLVNRHFRAHTEDSQSDDETERSKSEAEESLGQTDPDGKVVRSRTKSFGERVNKMVFDGCPVCGQPTMKKEKTLPRVCSCISCGAKLEQELWNIAIVARYTLTEGDSELVGETRKVTEWRSMNPRQDSGRTAESE